MYGAVVECLCYEYALKLSVGPRLVCVGQQARCGLWCGHGFCVVPVCQCAVLSLLLTVCAVVVCKLKNKLFNSDIMGLFYAFYW